MLPPVTIVIRRTTRLCDMSISRTLCRSSIKQCEAIFRTPRTSFRCGQDPSTSYTTYDPGTYGQYQPKRRVAHESHTRWTQEYTKVAVPLAGAYYAVN